MRWRPLAGRRCSTLTGGSLRQENRLAEPEQEVPKRSANASHLTAAQSGPQLVIAATQCPNMDGTLHGPTSASRNGASHKRCAIFA